MYMCPDKYIHKTCDKINLLMLWLKETHISPEKYIYRPMIKINILIKLHHKTYHKNIYIGLKVYVKNMTHVKKIY